MTRSGRPISACTERVDPPDVHRYNTAMSRAILLVLLLTGCPLGKPQGGSDPSNTGTGSDNAVVGPPSSLPDVPFEQLDHDQRVEFMKVKVVPTMEPLFKQHDPEEFSEFGCKTCHGPGVDKGEYAMPNELLPKLNFSDMSKFKQSDIDWMTKVVKPTMAKLLQEAEQSQDHPQGFGCLHCHTPDGA